MQVGLLLEGRMLSLERGPSRADVDIKVHILKAPSMCHSQSLACILTNVKPCDHCLSLPAHAGLSMSTPVKGCCRSRSEKQHRLTDACSTLPCLLLDALVSKYIHHCFIYMAWPLQIGSRLNHSQKPFHISRGAPTFLRKCCHCCTTSSPDANSLQVPQLQWLRASCICLPAMPRSLMPSEKSLNAQAVTQATIVSPQGTGCSLAESQPRRFDFKYLHTAKGAADRRGGTWTH